jgi:hypothetical protein
MSESNESFQDEDINEEIWDFIKYHPRIAGIPIADNKGLDILNALRDVWKLNTVKEKNAALTVLADVILSAAQGKPSKILEEVLVQEALITFDKGIEAVLDEGR